MKLDVIRVGCALSAVWALLVFLVGLGNLFKPTYGAELLKVMDSIYPGYHFGKGGFGGVVLMTFYSVIDGWIIGVIFALLYNLFTRGKRE